MFGKRGHEIRKLQSTGGSTFTVSLPKPWVTNFALGAHDPLRIDWRPSGALRITPLDMVEKGLNRAFFSINKLPKNSLHDHLMGAYISGADIIRIDFEKEQKKDTGLQIRRFLRSTRGFEIFKEDEGGVELMCIMNAGDMPLHASLNRMYLLVTSLIRDVLGVFEGEDRESEVDSLLYLIERQVRILLDSHKVATSLQLSRNQAIEYSNLARSLERMMDHSYSLSTLVHENPKLTSKMIGLTSLEQLPIWQQSLKELMINIRTRDSIRIENARDELKRSQKVLIAYEQDLLKNHRQNEWMAFGLSFSESVRRLCAYARDFGEILLNMMVFGELTQTSQKD